MNLYGFIRNDGVNRFDVLGLADGAASVNAIHLGVAPEDAQVDTIDTRIPNFKDLLPVQGGAKFGWALNPSARGYTGFHSGEIDCKCKCSTSRSGTKTYEVICEVKWDATIYINLAAPVDSSLGEILGHEQQHVVNMWRTIDNLIISRMEKTAVSFSGTGNGLSNCEIAADRLAFSWKPKLTKLLDAGDAHAGQPGAYPWTTLGILETMDPLPNTRYPREIPEYPDFRLPFPNPGEYPAAFTDN